MTNNNEEYEIKSKKTTEKTTDTNTKRKYIEYKKITPWNYRDTIPYDNCYIIIEKDSLFYYREGKLKEVRSMVREDNSDYAFTFKEDADDHIFFSHDKNTFIFKRDNYDGLYEYFILDKEYDNK